MVRGKAKGQAQCKDEEGSSPMIRGKEGGLQFKEGVQCKGEASSMLRRGWDKSNGKMGKGQVKCKVRFVYQR